MTRSALLISAFLFLLPFFHVHRKSPPMFSYVFQNVLFRGRLREPSLPPIFSFCHHSFRCSDEHEDAKPITSFEKIYLRLASRIHQTHQNTYFTFHTHTDFSRKTFYSFIHTTLTLSASRWFGQPIATKRVE